MNYPTRLAVGNEIIRIANDYNFIVINSDSKATGLENFKEIYPHREFTLGIAEQNVIAIAAGIASEHNKVIVSMFAVFASLRALEQTRTFICYPNLNVTILATHSGVQVGQDGATHSAIEDISIIKSLPNITLLQPSDSISAKAMAKYIVEFEGPLYVRLHRNAVDNIYEENYEFDFTKPTLVKNYGQEVGIFSTGVILAEAIKAADSLNKLGIFVSVWDFFMLKPLDEKYICEISNRYTYIITIEDNTILGGFGSSICEILSENKPKLIKRLGIRDKFTQSGNFDDLYRENNMDANSIVSAVINLIRDNTT